MFQLRINQNTLRRALVALRANRKDCFVVKIDDLGGVDFTLESDINRS